MTPTGLKSILKRFGLAQGVFWKHNHSVLVRGEFQKFLKQYGFFPGDFWEFLSRFGIVSGAYREFLNRFVLVPGVFREFLNRARLV